MQTKKILIVEDEDLIRSALREILELEGYTVASAVNGRDALQVLKQIEAPSLILLDLMMPVMNGWEFAKQLHQDQALAAIPIVLVTAYGEGAGGVRAQRLIKKPVDFDRLLEVVREYCGP
ncbi:MAG: response regulator [Bdellovibrionia bacterium]